MFIFPTSQSLVRQNWRKGKCTYISGRCKSVDASYFSNIIIIIIIIMIIIIFIIIMMMMIIIIIMLIIIIII